MAGAAVVAAGRGVDILHRRTACNLRHATASEAAASGLTSAVCCASQLINSKNVIALTRCCCCWPADPTPPPRRCWCASPPVQPFRHSRVCGAAQVTKIFGTTSIRVRMPSAAFIYFHSRRRRGCKNNAVFVGKLIGHRAKFTRGLLLLCVLAHTYYTGGFTALFCLAASASDAGCCSCVF